MQPTNDLIDTLYRSEVIRAGRMLPEAKLLAGAQLFHYACQITAAGIRTQFPGVDEERVHEMLMQRLAWQRKLDACRPEAESSRES